MAQAGKLDGGCLVPFVLEARPGIMIAGRTGGGASWLRFSVLGEHAYIVRAVRGPAFVLEQGVLGFAGGASSSCHGRGPKVALRASANLSCFLFLRGDLSKLKDDRETRRFIRGIARRGCQIRGGVAAAQWPQSKS